MSLHAQSDPPGVVQRRPRPRKEASDGEGVYRESTSSSGIDSDGGEFSHSNDCDMGQSLDIGSISFGALVKAQRTLDKRREIPRSRLQEVNGPGHWHDSGDRTEEGLLREERKEVLGRASKHAPTEISSKKAVSRKRDAVIVLKRESRDPRFDPLTGPLDDRTVKRNYSFLENYRESEMKSISDEIKRTKDGSVKEMLKKELISMISRKKAQEAKDNQQEILDAHRRKEKELVRQGKKPFFLKRAEQKKLALVQQYDKLKGGQLNRVIERKRKKRASKERKNMPLPRRKAELQADTGCI
ncbi:MAG: rRNA biogenesis protein rrp36 [Geoglossum simile]|nr:MAG: rRNA biogenesis protein rrp36 [Geoglossum simile]